MKLKYEFVTTELGEEIVAVPVGDTAMEFSGVLNLNASAAAILKLLAEETTEEKVVLTLMEEYEGSREELAAYVNEFVEQLREENLLTE